MTITEKTNGLVEIVTDKAHIIRRKNTADYPEQRRATIPAADIDQWEEIAVADIPPYSEAEYEAKVESLIRERYSVSQEFALINNVMAGVTEKRRAEYAAYQDYRAECKRRAKEILAQRGEEGEQ